MSDEFTNNVAQKFPNTSRQDSVERPWDVSETKPIPRIKKIGEESKRDEIAERVDGLYSELRSSLTIRDALEYDLKRAQRVLEEVSRIKLEVEKILDMLRAMDAYVKERIK